jgi:hypothetical protein
MASFLNLREISLAEYSLECVLFGSKLANHWYFFQGTLRFTGALSFTRLCASGCSAAIALTKRYFSHVPLLYSGMRTQP